MWKEFHEREEKKKNKRKKERGQKEELDKVFFAFGTHLKFLKEKRIQLKISWGGGE